MDFLLDGYELNITQACNMVGLQRCVYYYKRKITPEAKEEKDRLIADKLRELSQKYPKRGCAMFAGLMKKHGIAANHKRVYRIYCELGLNLKRRSCKQRVPDRVKEQIIIPRSPNEIWSMDFMSDSLQGGRKFRTLNIIVLDTSCLAGFQSLCSLHDDFNRELLDIVVDISISGHKVVEALETILLWRDKPKEIRVDNGSEFISHVFAQWCQKHEIRIKFIQKGKPTQNGLIERFNRSYREDVLDSYTFANLEEVRILTQEWMCHYNYERPHRSLGNISPIEYLENYHKNREEIKKETTEKQG